MKRPLRSLLPWAIPLTVAGMTWFLACGRDSSDDGIPETDPRSAPREPGNLRPLPGDSTQPVASSSGLKPEVRIPPLSHGSFSAAFEPGRPGAALIAIPTDAPESAPRETAVLPPDFLEKIVNASRERVQFTLPDGSSATGTVDLIRTGDAGILSIQGSLETPEKGEYFFQKQTSSGTAGAMAGNARFDGKSWGWKISPMGPGRTPLLHAAGLSQVVCVGQPMPDSPEAAQGEALSAAHQDQVTAKDQTPWNAPQDHPVNLPIPAIQNGVIVLESLPGAAGVIYLDFDGEPGPFTGWTKVTTDAQPSGTSNTQIKDIWQRVAEDYQPFNLNVTTDRRVFDRARETSRQHVIITPTTAAAPDGGGIAFIGSFDWSGDTVCWVFVRTGKNAAEAISHEVGHTLGLSHDGRKNPTEEYFAGHGTGDVSWAPLMGTGYTRNVTQWSKGEYENANNTQDDLSIIVNNNNSVDYRADDTSGTWATAQYLDLRPDFSVSDEGIIENRTDVDAWRFETTGGPASLRVATVNAGANLDILAEIHDRNNVLIASQNPDTQLNTALTAILPAGQYTLKVSGTGRGDPRTNGYSDYGSLGTYLISGTITNGIHHDRFSLDENTPAGTIVGRVLPRKEHGAHPLGYAITSGNTMGAFTISPAHGQLTVANAGVLDHETLSDRWDEPVEIELFVTITDSVDPLLNEQLRVVIMVNPVNEAPTLSANGVTLFTGTRPGTPVLTVGGSDPDHSDFPLYSIAGDTSGGSFAIDPITGLISTTINTPAAAPNSPYQLTIRATDQATPPLGKEITIPIKVFEAPAGYRPGGLMRSWYEGIPGSLVNNLITNSKFTENNPDGEELQLMADSGHHGSNYGSTARAWLLPPATGAYTFWISGDDSAELRLSSNESPAAASILASAPGSTGRYQYDRFPTQRSASVNLTAGTPYYLEARHKQSSGSDHLVIAWQGPGFSQQVISGLYLVPHLTNRPPGIAPQAFSLRREADSGARIGTVTASDSAGDSLASFTITGGTAAPWCAIDANTGLLFVKNAAALRATTAPSANLIVQVSDNGSPPLPGTGVVSLSLSGPEGGGAAGIIQEIWTGIAGSTVASLTSDPRYPGAPTTSRFLTKFDTEAGFGREYGSRIRTIVSVPTTGNYQFYIASSDESQLFFTPDSSGLNARQIASVASSTGRFIWDRFPSQKSAAISLKGGQKVYLEVRHKAGSGADFVQVAWTTTGRFTPLILSGSDLGGFDIIDINLPPAWSAPSYQFNINQGSPAGTVAGSVMATDPEAGLLNYTITSGNTNEAFSLNPYTGTLSLSNPAALIPGQTFALSLRVHDDGRKGLFPLQATPATAAITVVRDLVLLSPKNPGVNLPANQGLELETAGSGRPGAALTWSKVSGPGDVRFDDAGSPATGATFSTPGFYVIRATETAGGIPLTLDLTVQAGAAAALPHGRRIGLHNSTPAHTYFQGSWQINAGGTGLSNSPADSFYFINQTGRDTSSITARISAVQNVNGPQSMAGLMIRDGPGADARSVFCAITSSNGLRVITRSTPGLPSRIAFETNAASSFPFVPVWLRLIRLGDNFTAFSAPDLNGLPGSFTPIGTSWSVPMNPACFIGLAATSGSAESRGTFTIEDLSISPSLANLAPAITLSESVSLALHDTAALNGAVTDDSLPADPGYFTAMWKKTSGPGAVTFGSTSAPGTTASFATAGSYQLRLSAGDGEVRTFREVRLMIGRSPIEDWRDTKFGETTAFPGQSGDFADPDQDNLNNLLEYALNLEPLLPSVPDIAPVISGVGSRRYPGLNVTRNPDATDITMAIETTGTPDVAASWVTTGIIIEINTPTQLRARTTTPMDDSQRQFLRLKVSR